MSAVQSPTLTLQSSSRLEEEPSTTFQILLAPVFLYQGKEIVDDSL